MTKLRVRVQGRSGDYWRYTLSSWLREVKELLEQEYNVSIEIVEEDVDIGVPRILVENEIILEGVPGEEGYLIEALKKILDEIFKEPTRH